MIPRATTYVRIGGVEVAARTIHTVHDVDAPVGVADLTLRQPFPRSVDLEADVEIYAGWDGATLPLFAGKIAKINRSYDLRGGVARIDMEGHGRQLRFASPDDHSVTGPVRLDRYYRALCAWRGVPLFTADVAYAVDGSELILGSNPDVNGGKVTIAAGQRPEDQLTRILGHLGYRHFDTPAGPHRMQLVSGLPQQDLEGMVIYQEGVDLRSVARTATLRGTYNAVVVKGAEYQAADTSERAIRSIPATIETDPRFGPEGVNEYTVGPIDEFDTLALAQASRNAYEMDLGGEQYRWQWRVRGDAARQPGEAVAVFSPEMLRLLNGTLAENLVAELPMPLWLMRVEHTIGLGGGWVTDLEGWAGLGEERPAGNDSVFFNLLGSGGVHIGNEYLWHYRNPNPAGTQYDIPFTLPEDRSTATVRYIGHGTNSFVGNAESEASRFEVWHSTDTDRPSMSGTMPRLAENLEQRIPYGETSSGSYTNRGWDPGVVPLTGSLKAGSNVLRIIAGEDRTVGDIDDYEIASAVLEVQGAGTPVLV